MFRLIPLTVVGVVVLVLLFEVTREQETGPTEELYLGMVGELLEGQPPGEGWSWHLGPLPVPGAEGKKEDYVILTPRELDWGRGPEAEGRELPDPPPVPEVASGSGRAKHRAVVVAQGKAQTEWILVRNKGIGDHKLLRAYVAGRLVTSKMASLGAVSGLAPELRLYRCYFLPFTVYRDRQVIPVSPSSRCPMGKRLTQVGLPWIKWGKPVSTSATTCTTTFEPKELKYMEKLPKGKFELPIIE